MRVWIVFVAPAPAPLTPKPPSPPANARDAAPTSAVIEPLETAVKVSAPAVVVTVVSVAEASTSWSMVLVLIAAPIATATAVPPLTAAATDAAPARVLITAVSDALSSTVAPETVPRSIEASAPPKIVFVADVPVPLPAPLPPAEPATATAPAKTTAWISPPATAVIVTEPLVATMVASEVYALVVSRLVAVPRRFCATDAPMDAAPLPPPAIATEPEAAMTWARIVAVRVAVRRNAPVVVTEPPTT